MSDKQQSFEGQHPDEEIHTVFRRHPIVLRKPLIALLLLITVSMVPFSFWPTNLRWLYAIPAGLLIGLLIFGYYWIGWFYSVYVVTDQRFVQIKQKGFFDRKVVELGLDKIQNVNYEVSGVQATLFRFGTIVIQTFAGDLILDTIHRPEIVHRQIVDVMRAARPWQQIVRGEEDDS